MENYLKLSDLPVKAQRNILSYMGVRERERVKVVCKEWEQVITENFSFIVNDTICKMVRKGQRANYSYSAIMKNVTTDIPGDFSFCTGLRSLEISGVVAAYNLLKTLQYCSCLEELKFVKVILAKETLFSDSDASIISLPALRSFQFCIYRGKQSFSSDETIILDLMTKVQLPSLRRIAIKGHHDASVLQYEGLKPVLNSRPLAMLLLKNKRTIEEYNVEDVDFPPLGPPPHPADWDDWKEVYKALTLKRMKINSIETMEVEIELLNQKKTCQLELEMTSDVAWEIFKVELLEMNSENIVSVKGINLHSQVSLAPLSECTELQSVYISSTGGITDMLLFRALSLKKLQISLTRSLVKEELLVMISGLRSLTSLCLMMLVPQQANTDECIDSELIDKLLKCSKLTTLIFKNAPVKIQLIELYCKRTHGLQFFPAGEVPESLEYELNVDEFNSIGGYGSYDFDIYVNAGYKRECEES